MNLKLVKILAVICTANLLSFTARAASQILECSLGENQGSARIEVLRTEDPEVSVLRINVATKLAWYPSHIPKGSVVQFSGDLLAKKYSARNIEARGELHASRGSSLAPLPVILFGVPDHRGVSFTLIDRPSERPAGYIQLGYGVELHCQ